MSPARSIFRRTLSGLHAPYLFIGSICLLVVLVVLVVFLPPAVQAVEGTLELKADVASFSGTFTQAGNQPIRTAFGPLRLDYKSGPNTWTTGLLMREGDGNITIGAGITSADFAATSKLRVLGIVESTTGGFKFPDGTTQTAAASALPAGMVSFFNLSACPTGWTELTAARGRVMVGLPSAGTLAGTVGTGLTNLQNPTHTHSVDPASTATDSQGAHTHTGPSHTHNVGGSGSLAVATSDWYGITTTASGTGATSSNGAHTHSVDIAAFNSAATSATMPYIQLLACEKS